MTGVVHGQQQVPTTAAAPNSQVRLGWRWPFMCSVGAPAIPLVEGSGGSDSEFKIRISEELRSCCGLGLGSLGSPGV